MPPCVSKLGHLGLLPVCLVPSHYLNQCWLVVNWILGKRWIKIWHFSFKKMGLKIFFSKWHPFCLGLDAVSHDTKHKYISMFFFLTHHITAFGQHWFSNGLLPDSTKPSREPMLTCHHWVHIWNHSHISQGQQHESPAKTSTVIHPLLNSEESQYLNSEELQYISWNMHAVVLCLVL